ncbi:MAG TPA: DUF4169 family protein [Polyangiaceae bacterium]|jgi:hypothetical protein|nr:DUF4169 family protein [Polyangiaceae bacterium]
MAKIVNLNKFRKQKQKAEETKRADTNRRLHGRTRADRERERLEKKKLESVVDGAHLELVRDSAPTATSERDDSDDGGETR